MKTKINKDSRNLLIALLLGDGTISNNNVFKLCHTEKQKEYLEWKVKQLNERGLRNNGVKNYVTKTNYSNNVSVYYTQLNTIPFVKVLRRVVYKNQKTKGNRKLLNRLDTTGIAIWYMDDGHINLRKNKEGRVHGFYIKISICRPKLEVQTIIDYFKEVWNVNFYMYHEGKKEDSYSICCGTKEGLKFIEIVRPIVKQVPSMMYKIQFDLSQREKSLYDKSPWSSDRKSRNAQHHNNDEDIVSSL